MDDAFLPLEKKDDAPQEDCLPPGWKIGTQGTVVVLDDIDTLEWERPGRLMTLLEKEFGRIYRRTISTDGLRIRISTGNSPDGVQVIAHDPTGQLPGSAEVEMFGAMETRGTVTIRLDGKDVRSLPSIIDPITGRAAEINIKMVLFDMERVYKALNPRYTSTYRKNETRFLGLQHGQPRIQRGSQWTRDSARPVIGLFYQARRFQLFPWRDCVSGLLG